MAHTGSVHARDSQRATVDDPAAARASFQQEDARWTRRNQLRDWLILGGLIALSLGYHLAIFALQPGLR